MFVQKGSETTIFTSFQVSSCCHISEGLGWKSSSPVLFNIKIGRWDSLGRACRPSDL